MRYVRPFDFQEVAKPGASRWLISPDEGIGCSIQLRRGNSDVTTTSVPSERFALIMQGEAMLQSSEGSQSAPSGSVVFIPAGQSGGISGSPDTLWVEIEAMADSGSAKPRVVKVDPSRFEGEGFASQTLADRTIGAHSMRVNTLRVQPKRGSPDFHIHAFAQMYIILEGTMTLDIGRARLRAPRNSLVVLPAGVVHRNFNNSDQLERHVSLLMPEPAEGAVFDYAVDIHEHEATLMERVPQ